LVRFDMKDEKASKVGSFPPGLIVVNEAAAYDPKAAIFYAYLGPDPDPPGAVKTTVSHDQVTQPGDGLYAIDTNTGEVLQTREWPKDVIVADFVETVNGVAFAVLDNMTSSAPVHWSTMLAKLELSGSAEKPVSWIPAC